MSRYTTEGGMQATLDFGFQANATGFANGRPTTELRDFFAADDFYTDTDSNAYSLPTFLGNHDMGRIGYFLANAGNTGDELLQRDRLAHQLMYLSRGQPVVYYGDEQGFTGDGGDKGAREDMSRSQVAVVQRQRPHRHRRDHGRRQLRPDPPAVPADRRAGRAARRSTRRSPTGPSSTATPAGPPASTPSAGSTRGNGASTSSSPTTASSRRRRRSPRRHRARRSPVVWPAGASELRSDREARVTVTVPPLSAVVWRADRRVPGDRSAPTVNFRTPSPGGTVGGRAEVGVAVPQPGFDQVTIAWRRAGEQAWTPLGTDDNAPYRVFHDVSDLSKGTLVEYRAVLRDPSGRLAVAQTYATVGDPAPSGGGDPGGGGPVTQPDFVSVPGSLNSEMGCPGDWDPGCDQAQLTLDPDDLIWKGTYEALPAGAYEHKVALNKTWDENYGVGGVRNGPNIPLTLDGGSVTFYYDRSTNWVTTDVQSPIITVPGSHQSELGCPGDWSPDCMRPWLQDPDGDGTWTWSTTQLPAGSYEAKVAHGLSWDENYGAGGAPNGANIPFTVPADARVTFSYVLATHVLTITTSRPGPVPDLDVPRAHWLQRGLLAWDLPAQAAGWRFRLHAAPAGGLVVDDEAVTGGTSYPLTLDPAGLPAAVRTAWPHLATFEALRLPRAPRRRRAPHAARSRSPPTTTSGGSSTPPASRSPGSSTTSTATPTSAPSA